MEKQLLYFTVMALVTLLIPLLAHAAEALGKAPDFEAESTTGTIRLADYLGRKNVLLAFYFKNFTSG